MRGRLVRAVRSIGGIGRLNVWEAILSLAVTAATFVLAWVPFAVKLWTTPAPTLYGFEVATILLVAFTVRFVANSTRKFLPNRERRTGIQTRKAITTLALHDLTAICCRKAPPGQFGGFDRIRQNILDAVVSHVTQQLRDRFPGKVTASLLVLKDDRFRVVARGAGSDRPVGVTYQKDSLFCVKALEGGKTMSLGDLRRRDHEAAAKKPYRDILAVPVLGLHANPPHFGVVTVDSERPYVFGGREKELGLGLSPYIGLLKLSLLAEVDDSEGGT